MVYPCDKWEYAATITADLKWHIESKHEGVRYLCDKCEYAATSASHLKRYIESKYEGVRYPCDKSEYAATKAGSLKRHIKSKHEGVIQGVPKKHETWKTTWELWIDILIRLKGPSIKTNIWKISADCFLFKYLSEA